jgi:hypothetical protein
MATVSENLIALQNAKVAIKEAITEKGQDLTGVPFTEYSSKIDAIQSGESERSIKKYLEAGGTFYYQTEVVDFRPLLEYSDTENLTSPKNFFGKCSKLEYVPLLDTRKITNTYYWFNQCSKLVGGLPLFDLKNCGDFQGMFSNCSVLKVCPAYDMRSGGYGGNMFVGCKNLEEIWVRNISVNLQVGAGTSWGHLLTQESALSLCKECRKSIKTARTITFATPVYDYLETLYVKLIPITDEMRAEDDLIDEKLPFEVCESTDEGAKSLALYMLSKNWTIAK